ncbi:hypothetical protein CDAR_523111 [Caerostris darwini]|uniref:Uncharacterized protein n=1 Tax=Caerostris darwini TaxID=1538125 RepID=A0AAV4TE87_9ARAC|nr:hypothetical protein CDAR_523111 [Caerostris darwini]
MNEWKRSGGCSPKNPGNSHGRWPRLVCPYQTSSQPPPKAAKMPTEKMATAGTTWDMTPGKSSEIESLKFRPPGDAKLSVKGTAR